MDSIDLTNDIYLKLDETDDKINDIMNTINDIKENAANLQNKIEQDKFYSLFNVKAITNIDNLNIELHKGIDINSQDKKGKTLFHYAVLSGDLNVIKLLLEKRVKITILDNNNKIPLLQDDIQDNVKEFVLSTLYYRQEFILDNLSICCLLCNKPFSIFTRRHHCRHCGLLICSECSNNKYPLPSFNFSTPVRICNLCIKPIQQARKHLWKIDSTN